ncbi:MAG: cupin domain-containing protein [Actinomycetales bacterium]|nr:cupin domain-containing protein [Actinomycetales bacterium]
MDAADLIARFRLTVLPVEGTYFVRTYTSSIAAHDGTAAGSAIIGLFADAPRSRSLFHRVACDEMWHFYAGSPFRLITLAPGGASKSVVLGPDLTAGHEVQYLVPSGTWQAAELLPGGDWALFGCTVTPEFRPEHFESGYAEDLLPSWPDRAGDIRRLAVPPSEPAGLTDLLPPGS